MRCLLCLPLVLLLAGCLPQERIWWSPKGDRALVSIANELHLVNADGDLGPPLAGGLTLENTLVKTVSWLPDGDSFVCQRERKCRTWAEARALIPEEEAAAVERMAPVVLPLLQAAAHISENAKSLDDVVSELPMKDSKQLSAAVLLAYQNDPAALEKALMTLPEGRQIVEGLKGDDAGFEMSELCLVKLAAGKVTSARSLTRSLLKPALIPKISPTRQVVACLALDEKEETAALEVLPLDGGPALVVSQHVSGAFDWMPDGRTLVFMAPIGQKDEKLQSIHRITVVKEDGSLMSPPGEDKGPGHLTDPVTLATGIMLSRPVLQVLPDGRVLFATQPASLPVAGAVPDPSPCLYVISADGKNVQPVPTAPGDLPADLGYFTASPDGKLVAVVESDTEAVAVVEVGSGRTRIVSAPHSNWHCETMPAWKSAKELTFAALHGSANEPKLMSWTEDAGVRCISAKWPAAATADWLKYKEPAKDSEPVNTKPDSPR
jgi:hypothetical protein